MIKTTSSYWITAKKRKFNLRKYMGKVQFQPVNPLQYQKKNQG